MLNPSSLAVLGPLLLGLLLTISVEASVNMKISLTPSTFSSDVSTPVNVSVHCTIKEAQQQQRRRRRQQYSYDRYYFYTPQQSTMFLSRLRILAQAQDSAWQPLAQTTNMDPNRVYLDPVVQHMQATGSISSDMLSSASTISLQWSGLTSYAVRFRCDAITFSNGYQSSGQYHFRDTSMRTDALNSFSFAQISALNKDALLKDISALQTKSEEIKLNITQQFEQEIERAEIEELLSRIKTRLAETVSSHAAKIDTTARRLSDRLIEASENQAREIHRVESMLNTAVEGSLLMLWPQGSYGLPKPANGCPFTTGLLWQAGERRQHTESIDRNKDAVSPGNHLEQPVLYRVKEKNFVYQRFCVKPRDSSVGADWPKGSYCINKYEECPHGFKEGEIQWDDEDTHPNSTSRGELPGGIFKPSLTNIYYCCREDGSPFNLVDLPRFQPFYLYRYRGHCQQVAGMKASEEFIHFDTENSGNADHIKHFHPDAKTNNLVLHLCYYEKS
ncbi:Apextrin [Plakobranchus ocellatus]|uniref:Apextrin n=1 Tax=Plakobranchus ocellatus TaxID=259542 RepID=A0AAV4BNT2_9GAST|nr:Apextrin [Plakobranchus ocellatus]